MCCSVLLYTSLNNQPATKPEKKFLSFTKFLVMFSSISVLGGHYMNAHPKYHP